MVFVPSQTKTLAPKPGIVTMSRGYKPAVLNIYNVCKFEILVKGLFTFLVQRQHERGRKDCRGSLLGNNIIRVKMSILHSLLLIIRWRLINCMCIIVYIT